MKQTQMLFLFCCSMLVIASVALNVSGQTLENDDLINQRIELHISNESVVGALSILSDKPIPIGIEHSSSDMYERTIKIEAEKATLKEVLDLIVQQAPFYRWELRDGVINFVPTLGRDPFLAKLLDTRISHYTPQKDINKFELRNTLADLPEVRTVLEADGVTVFKISDYIYYPSIYYDKNVDLSISDTDVRGALNKIVRDSEHKLWLLGWRDKKKSLLALGF